MMDRLKFFPKYNFFNFFKPQGFLSFGFKYYERKIVSYTASRVTASIFFKGVSRPLVIRFLGQLRPSVNLIFNPFSKNFKASYFQLTSPKSDPANLRSSLPMLMLGKRTALAVTTILIHSGKIDALFYAQSWSIFRDRKSVV